MARGHRKGHFPFASCTNVHQIVGTPQVQFREVLHPVHLFDDEGEALVGLDSSSGPPVSQTATPQSRACLVSAEMTVATLFLPETAFV